MPPKSPKDSLPESKSRIEKKYQAVDEIKNNPHLNAWTKSIQKYAMQSEIFNKFNNYKIVLDAMRIRELEKEAPKLWAMLLLPQSKYDKITKEEIKALIIIISFV